MRSGSAAIVAITFALCACHSAASDVSLSSPAYSDTSSTLISFSMSLNSQVEIFEFNRTTRTPIRNCLGPFETGFQPSFFSFQNSGGRLVGGRWQPNLPIKQYRLVVATLPPGSYIAFGDFAGLGFSGLAFSIKRSEHLLLPSLSGAGSQIANLTSQSTSESSVLSLQHFTPARFAVESGLRPFITLPCFIMNF